MDEGTERLAELVEAGDPAALLRAVDGLCASRDWRGLVALRGLLEAAIERGRPLWPVRTWVEYRLALEAPGPEAASVLRPGAARFALGPLTEVAAAAHPWRELAPHLDSQAVAGSVAQERVLRGEDLRGDPRAAEHVLELPLVLAPWEPAYALATYRPDKLVPPDPPPLPEPRPVTTAAVAAPELDRPEVVRALLDLVEVWTSQSEGRARAAVVRGGASGTLARLGVRTPRVAPIAPGQALAWMAWAAASGGAHGVRRGAALGRFDAWWAAATLTGSDWPAEPQALGRAIERLRWWLWDDGMPATGWVLRVGVEDADAGWSAALDARDHAAPEDGAG